MFRLPRSPLLILAVACGVLLAAVLAVVERRGDSSEPRRRSATEVLATGRKPATAHPSEAIAEPTIAAPSSPDGARAHRRERREGAPADLPGGIRRATALAPPDDASRDGDVVAANWLVEEGSGPDVVPASAIAFQPASPADNAAPAADDSPPVAPQPELAEELPAAQTPTPGPPVSAPRLQFIPGEGDGDLAIDFVDEDIRNVLNGLSQAGGFNVVIGQSVQGRVSAALNGASIEEALQAILKTTGYIARWEGEFLYVGTPQEFAAIEQLLDTVGTRVYRPNYVTAEELKKLITPLLTPEIGRSETTTPAKQGIQNNVDEVEGNNFAGADALLVQDYECVLSVVDQIVAEVDRRPVQVAIEAMILSVRLDDSHEMGVDFQFLRDNGNIVFGTGSPLSDLADVSLDGGLKFAYLDSNFSAFLSTLETIGDTNVIATPRLMVLNKHRAQILIGSELGYVSTTVTETSTSQTVEFLQVGTQLRLRPFVSADGRIRMEIHPELSTGVVAVENGFTLPEKEVTEVTTNVMVPDGATMVLGGLMREDLVTTTTQVPFAGSLPVVGALFRHQEETIERREILVLVTPRIISEPEAAQEGHHAASEFHRRQSVYADQLSPLGKRHLGRKYFRMAQEAWAAGDGDAALRYVELAIGFDPLNRAAIDLRADVWAGSYDGDHSVPSRLQTPPPLEAIDGEEVAPWILEEVAPPVPPPATTQSDLRSPPAASRPLRDRTRGR